MDAQGNEEELDRRFEVLATSTIAHDRRGAAYVGPPGQLPFVKTNTKQAITPRQSSAGAFDNFPLEIQQEICKNLDFESIVTFSKTSYAAKIIVDSVFIFTETTSKAPCFLKAIAELKLLHVHSVATIAHVLSPSSCDFCPNYEFSLIRKTQAIKFFGSSSIKGLPSVFARMFCPPIPENYMTEVVEYFSAQKVVDMCSRRRYKTRQYHTASGDRFQPSQRLRYWGPDQRSQPIYAVAVRIPLLRDSESPHYMGGYYCRPCIMSWTKSKNTNRHRFLQIRVMSPHFEDGSARKIVDDTLNLPVRTIDEHVKHAKTCANARAFLWKGRGYISGKK
ncbi:uncharacterized protein EAE98_005200 [Botrytis deweyae]|uniref:F-box domain-containing protein n=1 Tax=Botrytis deweyae TaxID=2478750 RepID=A0ABQ7ING5_9HELO|nr:uncharacterized protein EAE98_005200 [Botrytis deweyae]KAF7929281.1 hypothetical protein EAE98_005200 [Botrytis deweyae]